MPVEFFFQGLRYRVVLRECNRGDETDQGCACYPGWHHTLGDGKIVSYCDRKLSTKAPEAEKTETNAADPKYLVAMVVSLCIVTAKLGAS